MSSPLAHELSEIRRDVNNQNDRLDSEYLVEPSLCNRVVYCCLKHLCNEYCETPTYI